MEKVIASLTILLASCATGGPTQTTKIVRAEPVLIVADRPVQTSSGGTFTAPRGWKMIQSGNLITLTEPDGELQVSIVDVSAKQLSIAIGQAWKRINPTRISL